MTRYAFIPLIIIAAAMTACGAPAPTPEVVAQVATPPAASPEPTDVSPPATSTVAKPTAEATPATHVEPTPTETAPATPDEPTPTETAPATPTQGPTEEQQQLLASLENRGPAPELFNEVWLNSEPLNLADLRGQVVLLEFWTFG